MTIKLKDNRLLTCCFCNKSIPSNMFLSIGVQVCSSCQHQHSKQLDLFEEIIVDNFAGGGGASTGIEMATGKSVTIAINHDSAAIQMHALNHPDTEHYCESVWDVDPFEACRGRKVGLAWFSPDCKHFSKAKGGKPVDKNIRGLAWIAVKWALAVKPRVMMLENVEEFKTWGPLDENGLPDETKKGQTFHSFIKALEALGYKVEFKELRACDYGTPTIRKRFFMIARCDGQSIKWPEATHGDPDSLEVKCGLKLPWRTASEIIDWNVNSTSIFTRKKPLAENTMIRITKGIQKFIINNPNPFVLNTENKSPVIAVKRPLNSYSQARGHLNSLNKSNGFELMSAFIAQHYKNSIGHELNKPLNAITTVNKASLVKAFITKYYGSDIGQGLKEPLHTITTKDRFGLVMVEGTPFQIMDVRMRMLQPHELYPANGFPTNYQYSQYADGRSIPKAEQVYRCGNAVPPQLPEILVRANLPELCAVTSRYAANF